MLLDKVEQAEIGICTRFNICKVLLLLRVRTAGHLEKLAVISSMALLRFPHRFHIQTILAGQPT